MIAIPQSRGLAGLGKMSDLKFGDVIDQMETLAHIRVQEVAGPLGRVRLTVRALGHAEGFVFCRHGSATPFALATEEWLGLPLAKENNYDV
jgi:hypothetical protein